MNKIIQNETSDENFDFTEFLQKSLPSHIKIIDQNFLEWLIGFIEGDGSFYYRKVENNKLRLGFKISQKDPKVLYRIKKTLGFGSVKESANKRYWIYKVDDKKNFQRIFFLLNGNLVLTKRYIQFNNWIKIANQLNFLPANFQFKSIKRQISKQTAWLSGFIDAEGCFYALLSTPSPRSSVSLTIRQKMHITQKNEYDEKQILEKIGKLFSSKAKVVLANKNFCYRIEISSLDSHKQISDYLNRFKLKTKKYIAFHQWTRVLKTRELKEHLIETNIPKLRRLCVAINKWNEKP